MQEELYVAALPEGLVVELPTAKESLSWSDIARIAHDPKDDTLVVHLRSGVSHVIRDRFSGVETATLARELDDLRRRIDFGLPV
jgi:hypothetical protein